VKDKYVVGQKMTREGHKMAGFSCSQGLKKCPALFKNTKYKGTKHKTLENHQNRLIQEKSAFL
jgi:hypothetical protein